MSIPTTLQGGRFTVRYELNRDACGVLFLANDTRMADREVVIRRLNDTASPQLMSQVAQLSHPTLPAVYDLFEEAGHRYLVLEHPSGQTLGDIVLGPPLSERNVLLWARQIAAGLNYLHHHRPPYVHGDLRPSTIVVQDGRQIKLTSGLPGGCPTPQPSRYVSPERWQGAPPSPADDTFAFAAVLHHLLSGSDPNSQPLHRFTPLQQRRNDISTGVANALSKALSADPAQRFPSVAALLEALEQSTGAGASSDLPAIGFTPSVIPAEGATIAMPKSPNRYAPPNDELTGYGSYDQPVFDDSHADYGAEPEYAEPSGSQYPRQRGAMQPRQQSQRGGTMGPLLLGIGLGVVILLLLGFFLLRSLNWKNTASGQTNVAGGVPTITRAEGRPITGFELTQTAIANLPTPTLIPTIDPNIAGAAETQVALAGTATAIADNLESLYQQGITAQNEGRWADAQQLFGSVLAIDRNYKDANQRLQEILDMLNGTAVAATATASAPTPTITPTIVVTPTLGVPEPTPEGQVFSDTFDTQILNPFVWQVEKGQGSANLIDGSLVLSGTNATCFPLVQPISTTTFPEDNYQVTIEFQYTDITELGTGFIISTDPSPACGAQDRNGSNWLGVWQDTAVGIEVQFHRDGVEGGDPALDHRIKYNGGNTDTSPYTFRLTVTGGIASVTLNDTLVFQERLSAPLNVLWLGNPGQSPVPGNWTTLTIDQVQIQRSQ